MGYGCKGNKRRVIIPASPSGDPEYNRRPLREKYVPGSPSGEVCPRVPFGRPGDIKKTAVKGTQRLLKSHEKSCRGRDRMPTLRSAS